MIRGSNSDTPATAPYPVQRLAKSTLRNAREASLGVKEAKKCNLVPVRIGALNDRFKSVWFT